MKPRGKIKAHTDRCKLRARFTSDQKQAKKSVAMAPQAPRDLRIGKVTATTIELRWAPPILDGGATVYEYEVIFSKTKITKIGKRETRNVEEMPPVATTAFVRVEPVAEYGYLLDELRASTEYSEFRVRCKNEVGWSEYCEPLGAYETKPAVPPGVARAMVAVLDPTGRGVIPIADLVECFAAAKRFAVEVDAVDLDARDASCWQRCGVRARCCVEGRHRGASARCCY